MDAYLAPYTPKHRYWTGLLLFARVLLYLVSVLNLSNNPRITLLAVNLTISFFFVLKTVYLVKMYRKSPIELLECSFYLNIVLLSLASFYSLGDQQSQIIAAYTSISIAMVLFFGIVFYHILCVVSNTRYVQALKKKLIKVKNRKQHGDAQVNLLTNELGALQTTLCHPTSTVVEISDEHSTEYSNVDELEKEASESEMQMQSDNSEINSMINNQ